MGTLRMHLSNHAAVTRMVAPLRFQTNSMKSEGNTSAPGVLEAALLSHSGTRVQHFQPVVEHAYSADTSFIKEVPKFEGKLFTEWLDDFESRASLAGLEEFRMK